jgi:hypothetical protein
VAQYWAGFIGNKCGFCSQPTIAKIIIKSTTTKRVLRLSKKAAFEIFSEKKIKNLHTGLKSNKEVKLVLENGG